jgi:hypothetical protein
VVDSVCHDFQRNGTQHNGNQHNGNQHNGTQHNDTQHNDTQHNDTTYVTMISIMTQQGHSPEVMIFSMMTLQA